MPESPAGLCRTWSRPLMWLLRACLTLLIVMPAGLLMAQADDPPWVRIVHKPYSVIPDLSFLNDGPAGMQGRVRAQGDGLVFADGTPARFWGTNLQAYALFHTGPRDIRAQAKRLASLGFNLVRIHHHDSGWVRPNVFTDPDTQTRTLDRAALKKIDLWIAALRAEGIYIWLDLHVGRRFVKGDGLDGFDEIADDEGRADIKGYNFVSETAQQRMLDFQKTYLDHVNHVTGISYRDDPAVIAVLITNENDLSHHFGNRLLGDKGVPFHSGIYMARARAFAQDHGLDKGSIWRSWEHGPSKIFLADLEHRFFGLMTDDLRDAGYDGMVVPTNFWGDMPLSGLPSLSTGSLIDVHSYADRDHLTRSPLEQEDMLSRIAAVQVPGLPLSVSEWNAGKFPRRDRAVLPLRMAATAAHQGWDAPMIYGYSQQPLGKSLQPDNWSVASDPAVIATLPVAALLFRQGHVRLAEKTYALRLSPEMLFGRKISPETSAAIRTIYEQSRLVTEIPAVAELPWLTPREAPSDAITIDDPDRSFLEPGATKVTADTGEFSRDFVAGHFRIETGQSKVIAGAIGGLDADLGSVSARLDQSAGVIAVQSLDGVPTERSGRLLITAIAGIRPVGDGKPAFRVEPLSGVLHITAPAGMTLRDLTGKAVPAGITADGYSVGLANLSGLTWTILSP
nr:cellulase family glycosylhydrolase [Roseobacter ponti]